MTIPIDRKITVCVEGRVSHLSSGGRPVFFAVMAKYLSAYRKTHRGHLWWKKEERVPVMRWEIIGKFDSVDEATEFIETLRTRGWDVTVVEPPEGV